MSDRIEASDILSEDATAKIKEFNDSIKQTATYAASLNKVVNSMGKNDFINSSSIAQHNKDLAEGTRELNKLNAEKLKSQKIAFEAAKQIEKEAATISKVAKETAKAAKEQENLNSVYQQTLKKHNDLSKAQMELSARNREGGKVFKALSQEVTALRQTLDKAEQGAGRFQRNVGNYKSGFNGLSNSVNQLTREMPAFANSMQTGFMAISNNLPIFFDELTKTNDQLKAMKANGEKVPSLFKSLANSIMTWGTALSIGVTLLTVFGKAMVNMVVDLVKGDTAFKISGEKMSTYYQDMKKHNDEYFESRLKLRVLEKTMTAKEADEWRQNATLKMEQLKALETHNSRLLEIATKYKIDIKKIQDGGRLNESPFAATYPGQNTQVQSIVKINKAVKDAEDLYNAELEVINKTDFTKRKIIEKGTKYDEKVAKDKAFKLTDQDKRILDSMEMKDEKKMNAEENLKKWTQESEEEQLKNTKQNIKTESDAIIDAHNADIESIEKLQKDKKALKDKEAKEDKDRLQATFDWIKEVDKAKNDALEKQLNADLEMRQRNIIQQQQLAIAGKENTLAFEKAAAAKDELAKIELAKKEEKRAKGMAFLKLVSAYAEKGDADGAVTKSLIQMAIAGAIIGSYEEGTEDTGNAGDADNKGGKWAILHPNERVLTKGQNKMIGDITNEELANIAKMHNDGLLPNYITNNSTGSFAENIANSLLIKQFSVMNAEIKDIKQALKDRPVHQSNYSKDTDEIIDRRITNGFIQQSRLKSSSKLNYI